MGGKNVKNTIVEQLMEMVAPHPCYGCGKKGSLLCDNCKYDISFEPFVGCIFCERPQREGVCTAHDVPFSRVIIAGRREGTLKAVIDGLKFRNQKAAARCLAKVLDERLPLLPENTRIVPVPTAASHVRQRGYDQVELIARHLATLRGLQIDAVLVRKDNATQHVAGRAQRQQQARRAYGVRPGARAVAGANYLLIDDIITTGATVTEAAAVLSAAGGRVMVAALAYQPLSPLD